MPRSDSPQVSVVIPVYNGERYLAEAIQSVVGQTYRDFELIVVDDGSTDGSALMARSFGDAVRYYYQKNGGPSKARNATIALLSSGGLYSSLRGSRCWSSLPSSRPPPSGD